VIVTCRNGFTHVENINPSISGNISLPRRVYVVSLSVPRLKLFVCLFVVVVVFVFIVVMVVIVIFPQVILKI